MPLERHLAAQLLQEQTHSGCLSFCRSCRFHKSKMGDVGYQATLSGVAEEQFQALEIIGIEGIIYIASQILFDRWRGQPDSGRPLTGQGVEVFWLEAVIARALEDAG